MFLPQIQNSSSHVMELSKNGWGYHGGTRVPTITHPLKNSSHSSYWDPWHTSKLGIPGLLALRRLPRQRSSRAPKCWRKLPRGWEIQMATPKKNPPGEYPIIAGKWIFNDMAVCQNPGTPGEHQNSW
jgi:hypothetical protein